MFVGIAGGVAAGAPLLRSVQESVTEQAHVCGRAHTALDASGYPTLWDVIQSYATCGGAAMK